MPLSRIKASIVGMRFYGDDSINSILQPNQNIRLKREPENRYDKNAVAVTIRNKIVGHLDKDSALKISVFLDRNEDYAVSIDGSRAYSTNSIPVIVSIQSSLDYVKAPELPNSNVAGIYKIVIKSKFTYVGQSTNIAKRILSHWDDFNKGIHSNPNMQKIWHERGGRGFYPEIIEVAPQNISELELSRWLVNREKYWIEKFGGQKATLNRVEPEIVLTKDAKKQLIQEEKEAEALRKEERKAQKEAYERLKKDLQLVSSRLLPLRTELANISKRISSSSGVVGYLINSKEQKQELPSLHSRAEYLKQQITSLEAYVTKYNEDINKLKKILFPRKSKRNYHLFDYTKRGF